MNKLMATYPELKMLMGDVVVTPDAVATGDVKFAEYNRTILSIKLFTWALEGGGKNYGKFTECQKGGKLSRKSFDEIHSYTIAVIKNDADHNAMITYLIINDLGKVKSFVNKTNVKLGLNKVDHDEILYLGLSRFPELSSTFSDLDDRYKQLILNGLKTKFNVGQFIQSENLPKNLEPLVNIDQSSFYFYMLHALYDIGGALGHKERQGSKIINDTFWNDFKIAEKQLEKVMAGGDINQVYGEFLQAKADILNINMQNKECKAIVKLCNMMRVNDAKTAKEIKHIFNSQQSNIRKTLEKELSTTGVGVDNGIRLYYAPATLSNAVDYFENNNSENPVKAALDVVLPAFARIFSQTRSNIGKVKNHENVTTVMIREIATQAKLNPNELTKNRFVFRKIGSDYEVKPKITSKYVCNSGF